MIIEAVGKDQHYNWPFMGGPLDGQFIVTIDEKKPPRIRCYLHAHLEFYDNDRGGLPSNWVEIDGEHYAHSVVYEWSGSTCAYVVKRAADSS